MLSSTPHCSTPHAANRAARSALLSVLAAALLLAGSAAALSADAYAGTPTAGLLTSSAGTEKAVTGPLHAATQPVSQPPAIKPPAPRAGVASAAVPPPTSHALTSATSAVTQGQPASPPSSGASSPPTPLTVSPGITQPQTPARSVTPLSGATSQVAGGASQVAGGGGPAMVESAARVASQVIPLHATGPASTLRPAGTIGMAPQQLAAAVAPPVGAIHRSSAGALASVTSAAPGSPALQGVISHVLTASLPAATKLVICWMICW